MSLCRVLIADDVADMRELMRFALDPQRFEVVGEAENGHEAVEMARQEQPDAIILDLAMPVKDGLQAIREIRGGAAPDAKILVLSGFTEESISNECMSLGANAYLEKGSSMKQLSSILGELCQRAS